MIFFSISLKYSVISKENDENIDVKNERARLSERELIDE